MSDLGNSVSRAAWRGQLEQFVQSQPFQRGVIALIIVNALILGLETSPSVMAQFGVWLSAEC